MGQLQKLDKEYFGLKVILDLGMQETNGKKKVRKAVFQCTCGNTFTARVGAIKSKTTRSCGCYHKAQISKAVKKHGLSKSSEYNTWRELKDRCLRKTHKDYPNYGGRGITICDEWLQFENFLRDMGKRPFKDAEIDRIDNDKGYSKENCRWVRRAINTRNMRSRKNKTGYRDLSTFNTKKDGTGKQRYRASIVVDYKKITIGYYDTAKEAAKAYNDYVDKHNTGHIKNVLG